MSEEQFGIVITLVNSSIQIIDMVRVFNNEVGELEQFGLKKKNFYNKVTMERAKVAMKGDVASLVECFK